MPTFSQSPTSNPDFACMEIATIFAKAILRLRARGILDAKPDTATCLEVPPETRLSVPAG